MLSKLCLQGVACEHSFSGTLRLRAGACSLPEIPILPTRFHDESNFITDTDIDGSGV
jgi:hypothetical protein